MAATSYAASEVTVTIVGGIWSGDVQGAAEDDFVSVARTQDVWSKSVGCTGEVARSRSGDESGQIKIKLMSTSSQNDEFSAMANLDDTSGVGVFSITIKDSSGRAKYSSSQAWIIGHPERNFGAKVGETEWVIECATLSMSTLGNTTMPTIA